MYKPFRPTKKYITAFNDLYKSSYTPHSDQQELPLDLESVKSTKASKQSSISDESEYVAQLKVVKWLRSKQIRHHHSPNGMRSNAREGAKFKSVGMSAGFPDLVIPYARKGYHGLFIELKRRSGGSLSIYQKEWGEFLESQGYLFKVCRGDEETILVVIDYFKD